MSYDPDAIDPAERISRFAYETRHFRADGKPKTKAFEPDGDNEVSVFRIDDLTDAEVWALGDAAGVNRGKAAKASIVFTAEGVTQVGLQLAIAEPPPRHAAIVGWPMDHLMLQKQQEMVGISAVRYRPDA